MIDCFGLIYHFLKKQTYATHSSGKVLKDGFPILSFDEKSDLPWSVPFVFFAEALSVGVQSSAQAILWPTSQLYMKRNMQIAPPPKTMTRSFFKTCMFPDLALMVACEFGKQTFALKWLESARLGVGRCTHRSRRVHRITVSLEIAITWRLFCGPGLAGIKETDVSQALTSMGTLEMGRNTWISGGWVRFDHGHKLDLQKGSMIYRLRSGIPNTPHDLTSQVLESPESFADHWRFATEVRLRGWKSTHTHTNGSIQVFSL